MPSWLPFMPGSHVDPRQLDSIRLISLCAVSADNSELWAEFLRRFTVKIKIFIHGTLRQYFHRADPLMLFDAAQETDLFQNTILRLVEHNCAALRRFSGKDESDFLAYLAVVARSTVRDYLRRTRAAKRFPPQKLVCAEEAEHMSLSVPSRASSGQSIERDILAREVAELSLRTIETQSGDHSARDRLIFELYFAQDLSAAQIAQCKGIGLSKAGVEKALNRLKGRVRSAATLSSTDTVELG